MEVALPHDLGREEVRRRLKENAHSIGDGIPGGMAEITTSWPSEDQMDMSIEAMGQTLSGQVSIEDTQVVFALELPMALAFIQPMIESTIRDQGSRLLAPPRE